MQERLSFSLIVFLCFSFSHTHSIRNKLLDNNSADKKESSRDGRFLPFIYLNPARDYGTGNGKYKLPYIFEGVGGFGSSGMNTIMQGLEGVAGFIGGKLGVILGGPIGLPLGAILGGLKGAYAGSEIGSQIAKTPFKIFKGLGSLGGQTYGSYTSYPGTDGIKYIIAHPK